jgi:hypothetical protein
MVGKLAIFAAGYVLGTRSGRQQYEQLVGLARWLVAREELQTALGLAQSAVQAAAERTQEPPSRGRRAA